jgi:hypothetical protein
MTRPWAGRSRFDSRHEKGFFSLRYRNQTGSGARPASYPMGARGTLVKRPGREGDFTSYYDTDVKNACSHTFMTSLTKIILRLAKI